MTQHNMWIKLKKELSPYGRIIRIENSAYLGTPDVYYNLLGHTGWIELKYGNDPVSLAQVIWLEEETRANGRAWLLIADVGGGRSLFTAKQARIIISSKIWPVGINVRKTRDLLLALCNLNQ